MKKIGFIPLRKGSKGIPNKNTNFMLGRPLFTWVLVEAIFSNLDEVYVYTDDITIIEYINKEYLWAKKVKALQRSNKSATDSASTESAILEFCKKINYKFDIFCLLQATSPLTRSIDINSCLEMLNDEFDSALTVVNTPRFLWSENGKPLNYNLENRPRRQNFPGILVENGAIYTTTKHNIKKYENRISGNIALVKMPEDTIHEVDSKLDWITVENLLIERQKESKKTSKINYLVLDVDGVFTDGTVSFSKDGEHTKVFDMRDGMGLEILRKNGVELIIISSENSMLVSKRMEKLNIINVFLGVKDKFAILKNIISEKGIEYANIAYIGDDINDLANICSVAWSFAPSNATDIVKQHADIVLSKKSGLGAIRETCEFLIKFNNRF